MEAEYNQDRKNMNRKGLTTCPVLSGEEKLRLLNFQSNFISKIENLDHLRNLVFLDFYNNNIEQIGGIENLSNLRVLMVSVLERSKCEKFKFVILRLFTNPAGPQSHSETL